MRNSFNFLLIALICMDSCYLIGASLESLRKCFALATTIHLYLFPYFLYPGINIAGKTTINLYEIIRNKNYNYLFVHSQSTFFLLFNYNSDRFHYNDSWYRSRTLHCCSLSNRLQSSNQQSRSLQVSVVSLPKRTLIRCSEFLVRPGSYKNGSGTNC